MRTLDAIPDSLDRALRDAVQSAVGCYGGAVATIRRGYDHDGDDCIFVEIDYTRPDIAVDPAMIAAVDGRLRNVAYDQGEHNILYIHNHFCADQKFDQSALDRMLSKPPRHVRG